MNKTLVENLVKITLCSFLDNKIDQKIFVTKEHSGIDKKSEKICTIRGIKVITNIKTCLFLSPEI